VADPCEKEKKALDKATKERDKAEGRLAYWDERIEGWVEEAQRALGSIGECNIEWGPRSPGGMRVGHHRLDEQCVIDQWLYAWKLLEAAREFRSGSVYLDLLTRVEVMREEEEFRKAAYCACVNGETPP
jgi:hypothetical protein